jgi:hypothetical protein
MEQDPLLRRLERDALAACLVMTAAALLVWRGDPAVAGGVLAGGGLSALSYRAIKGAVDPLVVGEVTTRRARLRWWPLVKFFTRYAMLGLAAYVMLVRLRLHPVGLVAGASSVVIAVAAQAIRGATRPVARKE